ncbi:MAG: cobalamin B12-binding domain-containing protein [Elusimicrobia bacterium]|nr:cobalamin B12-binding domain-containing protein [Elusimicrobiota bacterium]
MARTAAMAPMGNGELREGTRRAVFLTRPHSARALSRGPRALSPPGTGKVLLFRNDLDPAGRTTAGASWHQATLYLASALRAAGVPVVLSRLSLSRLDETGPRGLAGLGRLLRDQPDISFVGLTLYDSVFEPARRLLRFLASRTDAWLAVGGTMPTLAPQEVFVHLPAAHFVVRGAGEEVLPRLLGILGAAGARAGLRPAQRRALAGLQGILFADRDGIITAGADRVLRVTDLDRSRLDFSLLEKGDVAAGQFWSLSRGCRGGCRFCSSWDKGRFAGKSPQDFAALLSAYGRRLRELYGRWAKVPPAAFGIGFYDDDFLADRDRALALLRLLERSPFFARFLQTGVNSFFRRGALDEGLLAALRPAVFLPKVGDERAAARMGPWLYIGTESFCGAELARLGKGYGAQRVEAAARELSRRGIRQSHHFIVANARTTLEDLLESLVRIVRLRQLCGEPFAVLEPVSQLRSFYPTASYRGLARDGLLSRLELRGTLRLAGFPRFDYPLVEKDVPADPEVRRFCARLAGRTGIDWKAELEGLLLETLILSERLRRAAPARAARLRAAADRFRRYHELAEA